MKNNDSLKRIKAMAEALAKIQKAQDEQKAMQAMEEVEDDDMDLVADMLMEIADLLKNGCATMAKKIWRRKQAVLLRSPVCWM